MRIRKRFQNPLPSPDLPSPLPPSSGPAVAAAAAAPPVAAERGATVGVKEGETVVAAAAALRSGGDRCGGGGGGVRKGGFHPNGLAASPTPCLPPSGAAAAEEREGGVPAPKPGLRLPSERGALRDYGLDKEVTVPKRDAGDVKEIGDALSCNGSANLTASRSLGAEASEASSRGPGHTAPPPVTAERAVPAGWRKEERNELFPLMKRRAAGRHARGRSLGLAEEEQEEEDAVAERDVKPTPPGMSKRRRGAAAFGTKSTMAAAAKKSDDHVVAKEEEGDVVSSSAAAAVVGGVKKRRSPAVLMEGSRCSRVNGRGWRCCQQTLVGYSLCEHHLGKGRLRSVSSVRTRKEEDVVGADHDHPAAGGGNKRRRNNVGTVKARSLSSLLCWIIIGCLFP